MSLISLNLIQSIVSLNNKVLSESINHPGALALALEEIATDAWNEAKELGIPTWQEVEDVQPAIRIDP